MPLKYKSRGRERWGYLGALPRSLGWIAGVKGIEGGGGLGISKRKKKGADVNVLKRKGEILLQDTARKHHGILKAPAPPLALALNLRDLKFFDSGERNVRGKAKSIHSS